MAGLAIIGSIVVVLAGDIWDRTLLDRVTDMKQVARFEGPDEIALFDGDAHRLRQIMTNLVGNAIKFTERGLVSINLTCIRSESVPGTTRNYVRVVFTLVDAGIGIPAKKVAQLFKPFSSVDTSSKRRRGGTGLGLVISKRLGELMGGAISVDSTPGEGSTFRFSAQFDYEKGDSRSPVGAPESPPNSRLSENPARA